MEYQVILKKGDEEIGRTYYRKSMGLDVPITSEKMARRIGDEQVQAHGGKPHNFEILRVNDR